MLVHCKPVIDGTAFKYHLDMLRSITKLKFDYFSRFVTAQILKLQLYRLYNSNITGPLQELHSSGLRKCWYRPSRC